MRQFEIKAEKTINGNRFYIRPFAAFKAVNISGEIMSLMIPVLAAATPVAEAVFRKSDEVSLLDVDAEKIAPALANMVSGISGDKMEGFLKTLLVRHGNVSVTAKGESEPVTMTEDDADEIFCGEVQDMFVLAVEVIKANYSGFFGKLGSRFGGVIEKLLQKV